MRILIADDHELLRDALRSYLEAEGDFSVDTTANLPEALERLADRGPYDLVLLDYGMPGMSSYTGLEQAIAANAGRPVALMSGLAPSGVRERVLALGSAGYVPKTLPGRSLIAAINFMIAGETYMPLDYTVPNPVADSDGMGLSPRERQVLAGLCDGKTNKELARDLDLREPTIKLHVKLICRKLGARNRTHAAMIGRERNLC